MMYSDDGINDRGISYNYTADVGAEVLATITVKAIAVANIFRPASSIVEEVLLAVRTT